MRYSYLIRAGMLFFWLCAILFFVYSSSLLQSVLQLGSQQPVITIMSWTDILDPVVIDRFEKETGIHVKISYYESNEELYVRFRATAGKGHDLIVPSDYMVERLIQDNLLKPLDISKLTIWPRLDDRLLGLYYDPENIYSIPYYWAVYGIGYNKRHMGAVLPPASWGLIFNEHFVRGPIAMPNVAREAALIAAVYLFGTTTQLDKKNLHV